MKINPIFWQYLIPQHWISRFVGLFTNSAYPPLKNALIRKAITHYDINMHEAESSDIQHYKTFNEFFTRALKPNVRTWPIAPDVLASPADGTISQFGNIQQGQLIQAKGHLFSVQALLGGDADQAALFQSGSFMTIYLAPKNYHRVHMPFSGKWKSMVYVPGQLFSVNPLTSEHVPKLFARNERVINFFETDKGQLAVIMVGALICANIDIVQHGIVTPPHHGKIQRWKYDDKPEYHLVRGAELGRFMLGSTVIVLSDQNIRWDAKCSADQTIQVGSPLGSFC